jgi:DNA-binding MarR family transcriptional regulator
LTGPTILHNVDITNVGIANESDRRRPHIRQHEKETQMNSSTSPLEQLIGQTEKAMNAILNRLLAGAVTEPQWVTLVLTARSGGSADRDQFSGRVAHALQSDRATAADHIGQLAAKGLVSTAGGAVTLTEAGRQLLGRVQGQTGEITQRLWGDLPAADHEAVRRMLSTVLERAQAELRAGA